MIPLIHGFWKKPNAEIYVQSMTPMMKDAQLKDLNNANLDKYNQQLKELCTKKGYHFVDVPALPASFPIPPTIPNHGLHFTMPVRKLD